MLATLRWMVVVVLVVHGLLHLPGVAAGFGWAEIEQLGQPIGPAGAVLWLLADLVVGARRGRGCRLADCDPHVVE
jgi:hypothetical protein